MSEINNRFLPLESMRKRGTRHIFRTEKLGRQKK